MINVCKMDAEGRETYRYTGNVIAQGVNWIQVEAFFGLPDKDGGYVVFRKGDRFVEWYYADRWYNISAVHDVSDGHLKGWYCNITRPPTITADTIYWPDLALDVWVTPAGDFHVLDHDEFEALSIDVETRANALRAVEELRTLVASRQTPFERLAGEPR